MSSMVRRRSLASGLANHVSLSGVQHFNPVMSKWLRSVAATQQLPAANQQMLQWQRQHQYISTNNQGNKMVGSMPRMAQLPQPHRSSRKLRRLRRELMYDPPQFNEMPLQNAIAFQEQETPVILPQWCRASGQVWQHSGVRQPTERTLEQCHKQQASDLSLVLKQQLQQLQLVKQQQRLQLWQQRQQLEQKHEAADPNSFRPFNFGIYADTLIDFWDKEATPVKASTPSLWQAPAAQQRGILKTSTARPQVKDFSYVRLAQQMAQPSKDQKPQDKMKESSQSAPVSFATKNPASCSTSTTTLTNQSVVQAGQETKAESCQATERKLTRLASDIDLNLTALRQLLQQKIEEKPKLKQADEPKTAMEGEKVLKEEELEMLRKILLPAPESSAKAQAKSKRSTLNLKKFFERNKLQRDQAHPLWDSLMQLATHMCEKRKQEEQADKKSPALDRLCAGCGKKQSQNQKQYNVYLMVTSDVEDEDQFNDTNSVNPNDYRIHSAVDVTQYQKEPPPKLKCSSKRKQTNSCLSLPAKRPLHWPKPDLSKSQIIVRQKKLPRRSASRTSASKMRLRRSASTALESSWRLQQMPSGHRLQRNQYHMLAAQAPHNSYSQF